MSTPSKIPAHIDQSILQETVRALLPSLSAAPSDTPSAFFEAVLFWLNAWISEHGENAVKKIAPFALVYTPSLPVDGAWAKAPFFREARPLALSGVVVATSTSMLDVRMQETGARDLMEIGSQLCALGLDECPMLVVDAPRSMMLYCSGKPEGKRTAMTLDMSPITNLTQSSIDEQLERFHTQHTQYPDGFTHAWHDRSQGVIRSDSEAIIRDALYLHFKNVAFRSKFIVREEQTPAGRTDISIFDTHQNNTLACVLELKVLRSRGMSKKTGKGTRSYKAEVMERHARMGIRQAQKYKEAANPNAKWAYICLYDGRDKDEAMPDIEAVATARGVIYKKYYMEKSTRDDLVI